jgi:hypothetical protein
MGDGVMVRCAHGDRGEDTIPRSPYHPIIHHHERSEYSPSSGMPNASPALAIPIHDNDYDVFTSPLSDTF